MNDSAVRREMRSYLLSRRRFVPHRILWCGAVSTVVFMAWLSSGIGVAATTPRVAPPQGSVHCQLEADGLCHCGPRKGTGRNIPCKPDVPPAGSSETMPQWGVPFGNPTTLPPPQPRGVPLDPVVDMMDRINRYWTEVFSRCHWPPYDPPRTQPMTAQFLAHNPAFGRRSAFYVPALDPAWPPNLREILYVNDANLYRDRDAYSVLAPGAYAAEITLAHEVGHRIQDLLGTLHARPHQTEELEADFFAVTYVQWLDRNGLLPAGMITAGNLSRRAAGDPPGMPPTHPQSHGSALQRGNAFMRGVTQGLPAGFCTNGLGMP